MVMKPLDREDRYRRRSSRGAGRGIALALGEAGATVYVAARTSRAGPKPADGAPGTIEDTAAEVTARGGQGIAVRTDLERRKAGRGALPAGGTEQGRLDFWRTPPGARISCRSGQSPSGS